MDSQWFRRHQATGRAQARYLWVTLVTAIFYGALDRRAGLGPQDFLEIPIIRLEVSALYVWASGPLVLSFLMLVIMGSLRAHRTSRDALGLGEEGADAEPYDLYPNAIDLAAYTTTKTHRWIKVLTSLFAYYLFSVLVLAEALWLGWRLYHGADGTTQTILLALAIPLWIVAVWQVGSGWVKRVSKLWVERKARRSQRPPPSETVEDSGS